ncbi:MAG: hypothetical protein H7X77_10300 [Anaerolineae bacterium]|nr:hypothetical protein [Anaerolineae bacterium]
MSFPEDLAADPQARREFREEWFEILEDEQIAEGDITVSETSDGKDPTPDLDDEDEASELMDELMHEEDLD